MSRGEQGWQSDKTILQRNRYMLEREVAADVCFEVGASKSTKVVLRAHKYMLISASPVFEAMFCSGMAETNKENERIKVEDIQGQTFKEMLRYIYYEESCVTGECALQLMYAAHKYMIPNLVKLCERFLEDGLNDENVCCLLEHSLTFGAEELQKRCLALIAVSSSEIMKSKQFKEINTQTLNAVLDMNRMECSESFLYQACISWAKQQLKNDNPSDQAIRETFGKLLYKIRFPAMGQKEFTQFTADSDVLTPHEKLSIFYFLANGEKKNTFPFICEKRSKCVEKFCSRQTGLNNPYGDPYKRQNYMGHNETLNNPYGDPYKRQNYMLPSGTFNNPYGDPYKRQNYIGHNETLNFKTSHSILLTGIQLILSDSRYMYGQRTHKLTVSISHQKEVITTQTMEARTDPNTGQNKLVLTQPIFVTKQRDYTLAVTCSCINTGHYYPDAYDSGVYQVLSPEELIEEHYGDKSCADDVFTATISFPQSESGQYFVSGLYYKL